MTAGFCEQLTRSSIDSHARFCLLTTAFPKVITVSYGGSPTEGSEKACSRPSVNLLYPVNDAMFQPNVELPPQSVWKEESATFNPR